MFCCQRVVGICYRPPDQSDFFERLEEILNVSNYVLGQELIILGDLNTDMLKKDSPVFKHFSSFCKSYALKQIIVDPTRITPKSRTIIDIILVSDTSKTFKSGVLEVGLSDHNMIYVIRKLKRGAIRHHNTLKIRSLKRYSPQIFAEELSKVNWIEVMQCDDVDIAWDRFKRNFLQVLNKVAPYKEIRIKQRTEPWMTDSILKKIN